MKHDTTCAHCGADIIGIDTEIQNDHAHSFVMIVHHISTNSGYEFYQHESNQRVHRHNFNFWHCSKDHMVAASSNHIANMKVKFQSPAPGNIVNLHYVLEENLDCVVCGKPLIDEAYRLFITYATPVSQIIHNAADEEGWCCTLAHAKEHAVNVMAKL